jgi:hypothetical protein
LGCCRGQAQATGHRLLESSEARGRTGLCWDAPTPRAHPKTPCCIEPERQPADRARHDLDSGLSDQHQDLPALCLGGVFSIDICGMRYAAGPTLDPPSCGNETGAAALLPLFINGSPRPPFILRVCTFEYIDNEGLAAPALPLFVPRFFR